MSDHHIVSVKTYTQVFVALLILTVITVAVAQFHFGAANTFVALFIASIKAALVVLIFMGTKYDDKSSLVILGISLFFVFIFYLFSYLDIATRVAEKSTL